MSSVHVNRPHNIHDALIPQQYSTHPNHLLDFSQIQWSKLYHWSKTQLVASKYCTLSFQREKMLRQCWNCHLNYICGLTYKSIGCTIFTTELVLLAINTVQESIPIAKLGYIFGLFLNSSYPKGYFKFRSNSNWLTQQLIRVS